MPRGGRREGSGRKIRKAPPLDKGLARELFNDSSTRSRWEELRNAKDQWLRFSAEKFIWEQAEGKAVQRQEDTIIFDPNAPVKVIVEHIGRPAHPASAKAK